jgi:hypothetical protein
VKNLNNLVARPGFVKRIRHDGAYSGQIGSTFHGKGCERELTAWGSTCVRNQG